MKQPEKQLQIPHKLFQYLNDAEDESPITGALLCARPYQGPKRWILSMSYEEYDYLVDAAIPELMDMWLTNGTLEATQLYLQASMFLEQHGINSYN